MPITNKFILRTDRENSQGKCPVYLRVTHNRKSKYLKLGFAVKEKYWNENTQRIRRSHPSYNKLNHELERIFTEVQNIKLDLRKQKNVDAERIINILKGYDTRDFFTYGREYIEYLEEDGSIRLSKQTKVIVNKARRMYGEGDLPLNKVGHKFLTDLITFLKTECDNAPNTIRKDFARLKRLFDKAIKEKLIEDNPVDNIELPKRQRSKKVSLSLSQIEDIENLNLKIDSSLWHTRNYFLYSFYNAGIRVGDLMKLKRKHLFISGDAVRLKYLMNKTKKNTHPKWKRIKQFPQAVEILKLYDYKGKEPEEYLFPILDTAKNISDPLVFDRDKQSKTAMMNRDLKKIADLAEVEENVTTHIARHSFATFALKEGLDLYNISNALGHSKLSTTQQYISDFDEEMLDDELGNLYSKKAQT